MPGIAGIIGVGPRAERLIAVDAMVRCMMHERFYTSGVYANEELGLWTGWVCPQGTFADCMPVWNEWKDICLIFSGEDFADPAGIGALRAKGHVFDPENASYLVHQYEETGPGFLTRLDGWFSGLLVDLRERRVILFNDRFGVNRIYYHENGDGLYFSSEAKSLLKILPNVRQLDFRSLGEFISCGCILQNRTAFTGVSTIPGGSAWEFSPGRPVRKNVFFKKDAWEQQPLLSRSDYYEKLKETWTRVLPRYFGGKARVGLSLTGGVDSRMILAWAPCAAGALPCYTFGSRYRDCRDVRVSREVARICRQPHEVIPLGPEFLSRFPSLAEKAVYISDGAMDVTGSIDLYVQEMARQIAPVRLSGVYGGEILRRLVMFKPRVPEPGILDPELMRFVEATPTTYAKELEGHRLSFTAFKQAPWYMTGKFALERSQVTFRTPYFSNDLVALAYQAPPDMIPSIEPSLRLIVDGNPALENVPTDRGVMLRPIPGLTRAANLYQEFTFRAEYAYDYGMPQWLASFDSAVAPLHLERLFLGRHKIGHFRVWYRDELSRYVREILLDSRTLSRPYFCRSRLEEAIRGHLRGNRNHTVEISKLLTVELIQRQFIDNGGRGDGAGEDRTGSLVTACGAGPVE
jgi:asparagine synthase (glutamine-hydrolysing)